MHAWQQGLKIRPEEFLADWGVYMFLNLQYLIPINVSSNKIHIRVLNIIYLLTPVLQRVLYFLWFQIIITGYASRGENRSDIIHSAPFQIRPKEGYGMGF